MLANIGEIFISKNCVLNNENCDVLGSLCLVDSIHTTQRILTLCPKLAKSPIECVVETDRQV